MISVTFFFFFFFFNDTATTEIYTLSLHDALPICGQPRCSTQRAKAAAHHGYTVSTMCRPSQAGGCRRAAHSGRSEEHTSELQSHLNLVCRLLLEKKKK